MIQLIQIQRQVIFQEFPKSIQIEIKDEVVIGFQKDNLSLKKIYRKNC